VNFTDKNRSAHGDCIRGSLLGPLVRIHLRVPLLHSESAAVSSRSIRSSASHQTLAPAHLHVWLRSLLFGDSSYPISAAHVGVSATISYDPWNRISAPRQAPSPQALRHDFLQYACVHRSRLDRLSGRSKGGAFGSFAPLVVAHTSSPSVAFAFRITKIFPRKPKFPKR